MNTHLIAQQAKKFGDRIEIITDYTTTPTLYMPKHLADLVQELQNIGIHTVVHSGDGEKEDFASYDVSIIVGLDRMYYQNYYNKTVLVLDDWRREIVKEQDASAERSNTGHITSRDKWVWDGSDFIQHVNDNLSISDIGEPHSKNSGSYEVILRTSFTPLLKYFQRETLFPIYAGPIAEHAIDQLAVLDLVDLIKKKIYNGVDYFVFDDKDEAIYWTRIYTCHSIIKRIKKHIPGFDNRFLFFTGALNGQQVYSNWCKQNGLEEELIIVPCARFEAVAKGMMFDQGMVGHYNEMNREVYTGKREKKYLCYNRMPRLHRVKVITELHNAGLIEQGHVSFYNTDGHLDRWKGDRLPRDIGHWEDTMHYFFENVVPNLDYNLNKTAERWNPADLHRDDISHFDTSYFSIVNETLFYKDTYEYNHLVDIQPTNSVFLSEKIYKPLCLKHPFVVVGVDRTLENLRKFGYKTFSKWIDESYDLEPDCDKRMDMVMEEAKRLINLSHDEWQQIIKEMVPTLQHNFDVLGRNKELIAAPMNFSRMFMNNSVY